MGGNLETNYLYCLGYMMYLSRDVAQESTLRRREFADRYQQLAEHHTQRWEQQAERDHDKRRGKQCKPEQGLTLARRSAKNFQ